MRMPDMDQTELSVVMREQEETPRQYRLVDLGEFLTLELPPRENLLAPWLPRQGLAMIHAARGTGKTHLSLGIAIAVSTGGSFLRWEAPKPQGVLLLDGEMPGNVLQERLAQIIESTEAAHIAPVRILTPDLQANGMPDLGSPEGQAVVADMVGEDISLVIIDNLSTLVRSGKENESEGWHTIQEWALGLRAKGKSVLYIHHSGKGGTQRGTSKREDVLDTVIALRHAADYNPNDGAIFIVHFEKNRGFHGKDAEPFEARLTTVPNDKQIWVIRSLEDTTYDKVVRLAKDGLKQSDIAAELGVNKSTVSRHYNKAKSNGAIS